ncbi:hypothetical protein ACIP3A_03975 [Streptomyces tricolor]|uniref:hypothetical protein n=1 Tax=Streptomyces tricolor TaxID=68277 RepID=UPI0038030E36
MTLYDWLASLWRTAVPYVVGFVLVQLARLGITLNDATLTAALTGGFGTLYYALFRLLEQKAGKGWGWFLGLARPPRYPNSSGGTTLTGT